MSSVPREEAPLDAVAELLSARAGYRLDPVVSARLSRTVHDAAKARGRDLPGYVGELRTDPGGAAGAAGPDHGPGDLVLP